MTIFLSLCEATEWVHVNIRSKTIIAMYFSIIVVLCASCLFVICHLRGGLTTIAVNDGRYNYHHDRNG